MSELRLSSVPLADGPSLVILLRGRKDFTALLSAARNLSRLAWVQVTLPMGDDKSDANKGKHVGSREPMTRESLKKDKIRFLK